MSDVKYVLEFIYRLGDVILLVSIAATLIVPGSKDTTFLNNLAGVGAILAVFGLVSWFMAGLYK